MRGNCAVTTDPIMSNPYESRSEDTGDPALPESNTTAVFFGSLAAMLPWPLIATWLCHSMSLIDHVNEVALLFGGATCLFLFPFMLVIPLPESVFAALVILVWILALVLPTFRMTYGQHYGKVGMSTYVLQAMFSIVQAGIGLLIMLGKNV